MQCCDACGPLRLELCPRQGSVIASLTGVCLNVNRPQLQYVWELFSSVNFLNVTVPFVCEEQRSTSTGWLMYPL
jgi:hypothetical protein